MEILVIDKDFSICKVQNFSQVNLQSDFCFIGKTDEELSVVCETKDVPTNIVIRDDNWKAFRIQGVLEFSLVGILSKISKILADEKIGIFAISTYNTDYILTKKDNFSAAITALENKGYRIVI